MLGQGVLSCVLGSGMAPWGCEEDSSVSNSSGCSLRSHPTLLPPTQEVTWTQGAGVSALVAPSRLSEELSPSALWAMVSPSRVPLLEEFSLVTQNLVEANCKHDGSKGA